MENIYYVYGLINPDTQLPFYIGKGKGDRSCSHLKLSKSDTYNPRKRAKIKKLLAEGKQIDVMYYYTNLTNEEACNQEIALITQYGRVGIDPGGILTNLAEGGQGGPTMMFWTDSSREKMCRPGVKNPRAKLNEQQVIHIYHSEESIRDLATRFGISCAQIQAVKKKQSYKEVTSGIDSFPGISRNKFKTCIILTDEMVKQIYLEQGDYTYFKNKFKVTRRVIESIKLGITYKKVTQNLGTPGEFIRYKLTLGDIEAIKCSQDSCIVLGQKYGVHQETIRNIKKGLTRSPK